MAYSNILVEKKGAVGVIQLNRPKALNALNAELLDELGDALLSFDADEGVGAIVLTGSEKAFAAGADIKEMAEAGSVQMLLEERIDRFDRITKVKKPIIAAVSGWALGGGCELAMACDMIVASESAKFGQPEITIGVIPGAGGTQRLTRAVGKALAMEMVLNNRHLSAEEAYQFGLINKVVPLDEYLATAMEMAESIAAMPPLAVRIGKEMVNQAFETSLSQGLADERRSFYFLFSSQDQKEGMQAFIEKRKPEWKGE
jgi:enoyl-CoA hydratase